MYCNSSVVKKVFFKRFNLSYLSTSLISHLKRKKCVYLSITTRYDLEVKKLFGKSGKMDLLNIIDSNWKDLCPLKMDLFAGD